mmetsp:Transcript_33625/g.73796  ORF Transcript_33625/g.73796 Transcript_33625/m.73796 type:complete len:130 (+) Transcript_33625:1083-1472(+)
MPGRLRPGRRREFEPESAATGFVATVSFESQSSVAATTISGITFKITIISCISVEVNTTASIIILLLIITIIIIIISSSSSSSSIGISIISIVAVVSLSPSADEAEAPQTSQCCPRETCAGRGRHPESW